MICILQEINLQSELGSVLNQLDIPLEDLLWFARNRDVISKQPEKGPHDLLLTEALTSFLNQTKVSKARLTYVGYSLVLNEFRQFLESNWESADFNLVAISEVKQHHLESFLARRDYTISPATYNTELAYLKSFFHGYLQEEGYLSKAPTRRIKFLKTGDPPIRFLSKLEQKRILQRALKNREAGLRDFVIIYLGMHTGLRLNELATLNIDDIQLTNHMIMVLHGKGDKQRIVPLTIEVENVIRNYLNKVRNKFPLYSGGERPLFMEWKSSSKIERLSRDAMSKVIQRIFRFCGINSGCSHRLRHTYSVNLLESGYNVVEVMKLLGHSKLSTTLGYLHLDNKNILAKLRKDFPLAFYKVSQALEGADPLSHKLKERVKIYEF